MPLKLNPKDRKLLLGAAILFVIMVAGTLIFGSSQGSRAEFPTTYSAGSEGAKAAYLLLQESGYRVSRWERPLSALTGAEGKVLILAEPLEAPTRGDRQQLEKFISDGGHVIGTGMFVDAFLPQSASNPDPIEGLHWQKFPALSPSSITRAAPTIVLAPSSYWGFRSQALPLYGDEKSVRAVKYSYGKGEVIWWASSTPLTNAGLKEQGNLEFLLACLADGAQGAGKKEILWDEYVHGYRETLEDSTWHSPVMWLFLQLGLLAVAVLATFSRRHGPIFAPAAESRLSPLEFVNTLGGLYERANAGSVAVDISYQRFRYWLTRRLGLANNISIEDLETALRERWNFSDEHFTETLRQCESARYYPDLRPAVALRLVQQLDDYAVKLKLYNVSLKEKAR